MENSKIAALVELGILCRGDDIEVFGDGVADHGPHIYSGHSQLCRYVSREFQHPYANPRQSAYAVFPDDTTYESALEQTKMFVFIGAADSPELHSCLETHGTVVLIFEPDDRVLGEFTENLALSKLNREGVFCFTGNQYSFNPALQDILFKGLFEVGTPAVFLTDRIRKEYAGWANEVIEYLEILHYRHVIYGLSGQSLALSRPLRNISRSLFYDQQYHGYINVGEFLVWPDISQLKNRLRGQTAIVVAAGPDLSDKLDFIRKNKNRAVIICVNNALKPLVEAEIKPHFVVINDNSFASAEVFNHIPPCPETIMVGHCLAGLGGDKFKQKYLFGMFLPDVFGPRPWLKLHGSVISTGFSLAQDLGCTKCVIVGGQLASSNPWGLNYAKGAMKEASKEERPLVNEYPQLYPTKTPFGETVYTTLNFRDAALWLSEVIRLSGIPCINTSKSSILYGEGISYDPDPELADTDVRKEMASLFRFEPARPDFDKVLKYIDHELNMWVSIRTAAREILNESGQSFVSKGFGILEQLDKNNVTYLLERFESFDNRRFFEQTFSDSLEDREAGLRYYLEQIAVMSTSLLKALSKAKKEVDAGFSVFNGSSS